MFAADLERPFQRHNVSDDPEQAPHPITDPKEALPTVDTPDVPDIPEFYSALRNGRALKAAQDVRILEAWSHNLGLATDALTIFSRKRL